MNVFLPYQSFEKSAQTIDDKRLIKQILECKQIISMNDRKEKDDDYVNPYLHHPVVAHYKHQLHHIVDYALVMCKEYYYRFGKYHMLHAYFINQMRPYGGEFEPIFAAGSKNSPNAIRETNREKVYELFKMRLLEKWSKDVENGHLPKWTKRNIPEFIGEQL